MSAVKEKNNDELKDLFEEREQLKEKITNPLNIDEKDVLKAKLEQVDGDIADIQAENNYKTIKEQVKHCLKIWQLKRKLGVRKKDVKKNKKGDLVTYPVQLKQLYASTYKNCLEHRKMKPELVNMYNLMMNLFNMRFEVSKQIKYQDWTEDNLLKALKSLKKNMSADSDGLI